MMTYVTIAVIATCFAVPVATNVAIIQADDQTEGKATAESGGTPETFLLWTVAPPGARDGDEQRTKTIADDFLNWLKEAEIP